MLLSKLEEVVKSVNPILILEGVNCCISITMYSFKEDNFDNSKTLFPKYSQMLNQKKMSYSQQCLDTFPAFY